MESKGKDRRRHSRYLCSHLTDLVPPGRTLPVLLEDICWEGAGAGCEEALPPGTVVQLLAGSGAARAEVRYCLRRETDFRLGLRFTSYRWQIEVWQPDHLWRPE